MYPKRPRLRTFDYLGRYRYFLTLCTHLRRDVFIEAEPVNLVLAPILRSAERGGFDITAYCFMPDHLHLLAHGLSDHADLKEFVKRSKQTSGFRYKQATNRALWQPSYYDHTLRDDETSLWAIAYILRNPIVAGLVERCEDYPFLGSGSGTLAELIATLQEGLGSDWETRDLVPVGGTRAHEAGLKACATNDR